MTYFKTKLAEMEKGCGYDGSKYGQMVMINGTLDYAKCNDKTKCSECQAKIQQLKECEEEVKKAKEQMIMDFDNAFDAGYRNLSDVLFIIDKFSKELGIKGEKDE